MEISELKVSVKTQRMFELIGLSNIDSWVCFSGDDGALRPTEIIRLKLASKREKDGAGGFYFSAGVQDELFDALVAKLLEHVGNDQSKLTDLDRMAIPLISSMIQSTTGDIGGREQSKLFASLALDMVEALQFERVRRESGAR